MDGGAGGGGGGQADRSARPAGRPSDRIAWEFSSFLCSRGGRWQHLLFVETRNSRGGKRTTKKGTLQASRTGQYWRTPGARSPDPAGEFFKDSNN